MYVCAHVSGDATWVQKEAGYQIPAGVPGSCESPGVGAENHTPEEQQIFWTTASSHQPFS